MDDFGVSDAILLWGANSGQTSIKCRDLAYYNVEPLLLKNCKELNMKLDVKHLLPTLCSDTNFYICNLPEGLGLREIISVWY